MYAITTNMPVKVVKKRKTYVPKEIIDSAGVLLSFIVHRKTSNTKRPAIPVHSDSETIDRILEKIGKKDTVSFGTMQSLLDTSGVDVETAIEYVNDNRRVYSGRCLQRDTVTPMTTMKLTCDSFRVLMSFIHYTKSVLHDGIVCR